MAPLEIRVGERYETLWEQSRAAGYVRIRVDGQTYSVDEPPEIDRRRKHRVEVVVDRVTVRPDARSRIAGSVENALALGRGVLHVAYPQGRRARAALADARSTASISPATVAGGVSSRCRRTISPSTVRWAGARPAKGWACRRAPIRRPCCAIRSSRWPKGPWPLWPEAGSGVFRAMLEASPAPPACRWTCPSSSLAASTAGWSCTARASSGST